MTPDSSVAVPAAVVAAPVDRSRPNYRLLGLLALGRLVIDTNQGSLPALLPYIKAARGLTYTVTGGHRAHVHLGCAVSLTLPEPRSQ